MIGETVTIIFPRGQRKQENLCWNKLFQDPIARTSDVTSQEASKCTELLANWHPADLKELAYVKERVEWQKGTVYQKPVDGVSW
jgi:hypothetical protein